MKIFKTKKQRTIGLVSICLITIVGVYIVMVNKPKEKEVRYREYPVTKGDIIAGIEGTGSIYYEQVEQLLEQCAVIGTLYVKEGDKVKKGDKLVAFSTSWLTKQEEELKLALKKAENELEDGKKTLEISNEKYKQTSQDLQKQSQQEYEASRVEQERKLDEVKNTISQKESEIAETKEKTKEDNTPEIQQKLQQMLTEVDGLYKELRGIQASIEQIDAAYERTKQKNQSTIEMDKKNLELEVGKQTRSNELLEAEVKKAKENYEKLLACKENPFVLASVDGIVLKVIEGVSQQEESDTADHGVVQEPGTSVVTLGDVNKKMMKAYVIQEDVNKIKEGQKVEVQSNAFEDIIFYGTVQKCILKSVDQNGVIYYPIEVALEETDQPLLDGMTAFATFIQKEKKDVLSLSNKAIILEDGKQYVNIKDKDETIIKKEITTGFSDGIVSEIITGLEENEVVVVEG